MNYTYDDFVAAATNAGVMNKFSQQDLSVAKTNPEYGMSMMGLLQDISKATTEEQRLLATEAANQMRKNYGVSGTGTTTGALPSQTGTSFSYDGQDSYKQVLDKIVNPGEFSYDYEDDPRWSAYKKTYLREGDRATEDALAAASAATGGVPSSFAVTAAAQAGDYYAGQLADKIPELEQNAYQRYLQEQDLNYQALAAIQADRNFDYNEYLQRYEQGLTEQQMAQNQAQQEFSNALALYQALGYMTPEIEAALGLKTTESSANGGNQQSGPAVIQGNTGTGVGGPEDGPGNESDFDGDMTSLANKYQNGSVTDLSEWRDLVAKYGEEALYAKGFYFGSGFSGVTKESAVAYLTSHGVPADQAQKTMSAATWKNFKNDNAPDGYVRGNETYEDYLWNWVTDMILKYGK